MFLSMLMLTVSSVVGAGLLTQLLVTMQLEKFIFMPIGAYVLSWLFWFLTYRTYNAYDFKRWGGLKSLATGLGGLGLIVWELMRTPRPSGPPSDYEM